MYVPLKRIQRLLDIAIISAGVAILIQFAPEWPGWVKRYLNAKDVAATHLVSATSLRGIAGIQWRQAHSETFVLFLSETCAYCEQSARFYQKLARQIENNPSRRLIIVSADPASKMEVWARKHDIASGTVVQADPRLLMRVGLFATPTFVIADSSGVPRATWYGQLQPEEEAAVLDAMTATEVRVASHSTAIREINEAELNAIGSRVVVVDTSRRDKFVPRMDAGIPVVNIPKDELKVRAAAELPKSRPIVLDCRISVSIPRCLSPALGLMRLGYREILLLGASTAKAGL